MSKRTEVFINLEITRIISKSPRDNQLGVWLNFKQKCLGRKKEGGQEDTQAGDMRTYKPTVEALNTSYRFESQETEIGGSQGLIVRVTEIASSRFGQRLCLKI